MKSVVVIDSSLNGGICHYTFALCNALAAEGCQVSLVTSPGQYELSNLNRCFEIVPLLLPGPRRDGLKRRLVHKLNTKFRPEYWSENLGKQVGQYIQSQEAQVVHQQWVTDPKAELFFWASLRRQTQGRAPLVYTAHNVWPHESNSQLKEVYRELYTNPDRIIVHGENLRQQMVQEAAVSEQKIRVIPHGNYHYLANAVPAMSQAEARMKLGLPAEARVILFVGAIRYYKGLDVLLLAFERLLQRHTGIPYRLLIAGRLAGETWDQSLYGGLCRSLKVAEAVQVHQNYIPLSDFGQYFGAADIACFPYRNASQSGALQLAYSYRKPVVVTSVGSLPDAVLPGRTGLIVRPEEPDELADALQVLLNDPSQCQQMGEAAYQWVKEECSWEDIARRTLALYQEAGAGGSRISTL